jgi:hypothetical protein
MAWLTIRQVIVFVVLVLFCAIALNHSSWEHWYRAFFRPLFLLLGSTTHILWEGEIALWRRRRPPRTLQQIDPHLEHSQGQSS